MNDKLVWLATKYVKDGKTYTGISKLIVRHEVGLKKTVKAHFAGYGISEYEYKAFSSMGRAAMCRL